MSRLDNFDSTDVTDMTRRAVLKKGFIEAVAMNISQKVKRRLVRTELEALIRYLDSVDHSSLRGRKDQIIEMLAGNFVQRLNYKAGNSIDIHELLKSHIGGISSDVESIIILPDVGRKRCLPNNPAFEIKDSTMMDSLLTGDDRVKSTGDNFTNSAGFRTKNKAEVEAEQSLYPLLPDSSYVEQSYRAYLPPEVLYKHPMLANQRVQNIYLLLDSKYRVLNGDWSTFSWGVSANGLTPSGAVGTLADYIHNIINVQFNKFYLPYVPSADNFYNKIALFIKEFSAMSTLLNSKGRRFHMLFNTTALVGKFELTPLENDDGKFRFPTPVNELSNLTIQFFSPFNPVVFLPDRYSVTMIPVDIFHTIINFPEDHSVVDGDVVYIDDFIAASGPSAIVDGLNNENGFVVTYLNATQLQIDYDLTGIVLDPNNFPTCFIGSRRLILPIRMEYIPEPK